MRGSHSFSLHALTVDTRELQAWISIVGWLVGDKGIQEEENTGSDQRATDHGEADEGQGMNPDESR